MCGAVFDSHRIYQVVLAAAKVGGIQANNSFPAKFIYDNLMIEASVIHAAHLAGVQRLLFLGSSCICPRMAAQPMREDSLLTGTLESTNEPYAIAKIAGIKLCESYYRHLAVTDGAPEVVIWGGGAPMREFLHVDDMAAASVHVMELDDATYRSHTQPMLSHINVGTGVDCSIRELAVTVAQVTSFRGHLVFDASKPDGTPRKLHDVSRLRALGWQAHIGLEDGLRGAYAWFVAHQIDARR